MFKYTKPYLNYATNVTMRWGRQMSLVNFYFYTGFQLSMTYYTSNTTAMLYVYFRLLAEYPVIKMKWTNSKKAIRSSNVGGLQIYFVKIKAGIPLTIVHGYCTWISYMDIVHGHCTWTLYMDIVQSLV